VSPVVLRAGPYRCYFYSQEPDEPAHVHVDRDDCTAKLWLNPVGVAYAIGFRPHELRAVERLIREHQTTLLEAWNGRFPPRGG